MQNWDGKREVYDMREVYKKHVGRSYYHFLYHNVLFLILNNSMGDDAEMAEQKEYVTKVLNEHQGVRWTFTFFHYPTWFSKNDAIWRHTAPLLGERPFTAFAGNAHHYIQEHFDELHDGDVVDVEFILGETKAPKVSESVTVGR